MAGLLFRWFGLGGLPMEIRDQVRVENVLFETGGIRMVLHRSGSVPGATDGAGVSLSFGSFAVTERRVVACRGQGVLVNMPFELMKGGPAQLTLDTSGLHVRFDLDRVHPSCDGEMRLEFHERISDEVLQRFPAREGSFAVDPQKVVRLFGSMHQLPA
jgi:hypothetical protein